MKKERLTERVGDGIRYDNGEYMVTCYPKNNNLSEVDRMAVKLCELEDKIENGTLLELPCKVGDTVYEFDMFEYDNCKQGFERCPHLYCEYGEGYKCDKTRYGEKPLECTKIKVVVIEDITEIFRYYNWFGKTVFLTREDAEKELAERRNR